MRGLSSSRRTAELSSYLIGSRRITSWTLQVGSLEIHLVAHPNASRNVGFSYNTLYFINSYGSIVSYDLDNLITINAQQQEEFGVATQREGSCVDFTIYNNNRLFVITEQSFLEEVSRNTVIQRINLINLLVPPQTQDSLIFTAICSSKNFITLAGYWITSKTIIFAVFDYTFKLLDYYNQITPSSHVHNIKPVIKRQMTFILSASRYDTVSLLFIPQNKILILEENKYVTDGPIDGLCILGDSEALIYEGKYTSSMKMLRIM